MRRRFLPLAAAFSMMAAAAEDQSSGNGREAAGPHPTGERHTPESGDVLAVLRPSAAGSSGASAGQAAADVPSAAT